MPGLQAPRLHAQEPPTYYVNAANPAPAFPYTSWATAATNIQSAVDAGTTPGRLILVTDGVYQGGVSVTRAALRSVGGPAVTIIDGAGTRHCVELGTNATLSGFTVRNGLGGVSAEASGVVTNCLLTGNAVVGVGGWGGSGAYGAGACGGTLYNCILSGNLAWFNPLGGGRQ